MQKIKGFSRLSREQKIQWLEETLHPEPGFREILAGYRHSEKQPLFDGFSENTLSNFYLPFGVAPNFLIDGKFYVVPMVVEESSVVAAAARAASFWADRGGFHTIIHGTLKTGEIWFRWKGPADVIVPIPSELKTRLLTEVKPLIANMEKRRGGITAIELLPALETPDIWQLKVTFETANSMGANFINSCLEEMKEPLIDFFRTFKLLKQYDPPEVIMAILSNETPQCLVTCRVECPVKELAPIAGSLSPQIFARQFKTAVDIALHNTSRAVTHNKGIQNGTDAVVIATGNDFRAVEAAVHAYAARDGQYRSLSRCTLTPDNIFRLELTQPLALGTVGGLTNLHPLAALALDILGKPTARELMKIASAAGLANNFSAVASLVTTGIQKGHMKLHLNNLLNAMNAGNQQKKEAITFFEGKTVSVSAVRDFLDKTK